MMKKVFSPLCISGKVMHGFGRGSKELGCPTANMDKCAVQLAAHLPTGVYYGFAKVSNGPVYKAVTSVGWNPQYGNTEKSIEVHILQKFDDDFYDEQLKFMFLGYIRDECKFESLEALIARIHEDINEGSKKLEDLLDHKSDIFFTN